MRRSWLALALSSFMTMTSAQVPAVAPQPGAFDTQRLERISERFAADVKAGEIPGAVVLIAHQGKVIYQKAFGYRDRGGNAPMQPDSIFRIASMTKPVTAVAALILMEEGRIQLVDPVSRYIPEFKDLKVGIERTDAQGERVLELVPVARDFTVQDLMRHTAGFTYGIFGDSLVQRANRSANTLDDQQTNAEMVDKLAKLPLAFQPGTTFEYGMSTDVLGRLVEVVSGQDLASFVEQRITRPLQMADTRFLLNPDQARRLAEPLFFGPDGKPLVVGYNPAHPPKWFSGGGGLLSTATDYARFSQMLLNGGELEGVRILSRKSVALMTSDHLPPDVAYGDFTQELGMTAPLPRFGQGYGLAVGVRKEVGRSPVPGSVGDFYWGGATGPYFWIDPQEQLIAIMMLQELDIQKRTRYRSVMRDLVYQALE